MRCLSRRGGNFFVDQERYILEAREERSRNSHRRYFASINEAWKSLPEKVGDRYPSPEHLRKWALCKAGFADEDVTVWDSKGDARKAAVMMRKLDTFAVIVVKDNTVRRYTAQSQDMRSMDKATFHASVEAVERIVAELIGSSVKELRGAESA